MGTNFFTEFVTRLAKENPKFFKIIQWVALGVGSLAAALKYINGGVTLPWYLEWLKANSVLVGSVVTIIMAQLPNLSPNNVDKTKS